MLLKIDPKSAAQFNLIHETPGEIIATDHRRYYVATGNRLALLVLRNGLDLATITGQVVDARLGWDHAVEPFAPEGDVGLRRTKITVYRHVINAHPNGPMGGIKFLSTLLQSAPKRTPRKSP